MNTPWGKADRVQELGRGILFVTTPSHGGYFVPPELNGFIPLAHRLATWRGQGMDGWYEEDCDWCIVARTFRGLFCREAIDSAEQTFAHWFAPKLRRDRRDV